MFLVTVLKYFSMFFQILHINCFNKSISVPHLYRRGQLDHTHLPHPPLCTGVVRVLTAEQKLVCPVSTELLYHSVRHMPPDS